MSFMFETEDEAKNCIQVVSNLYKRLKQTSKKPKQVSQEVQSDLIVKSVTPNKK